jgi:hypothetical protein
MIGKRPTFQNEIITPDRSSKKISLFTAKPAEPKGVIKSIDPDLAAPFPLKRLDGTPLTDDKSVIVTPYTSNKIEGIKSIIDPVTVSGAVDVNIISGGGGEIVAYETAGFDMSYGNDYEIYRAPNGYSRIEFYCVMIWSTGISFGLTDQHDLRLIPDGLLIPAGTFFKLDIGGAPIAIIAAGGSIVLKTDTPDPNAYGLLYIRLVT